MNRTRGASTMTLAALRIPAALLALAALVGCGNDTPVRPQEPAFVPTLTPATQPPAAAVPTPTPEPQAERPNRPPTIAISGGGSCHPGVGHPCRVEFGV